jgi:hypothetical protein
VVADLTQQLDEDRNGLILHQHLAEAADDWRNECDPGAVYRSARLKAAQVSGGKSQAISARR